MKLRHIFLTGTSLVIPHIMASAQSIELFEEVDAEQAVLAPDGSGALHRHVRLNQDLAEQVFRGETPARSLSFELQPGEKVTFKTSDQDGKMARRTIIWSGRAEGSVDGSATLVYRRKGIVGHLQIGAETYRITPGKDGIHKITFLNMQDFPDEGSDMMTPSED